MRTHLFLLSAALLAPCLIEPAFAQGVIQAQAPRALESGLGVDLLSDTRGADLGPYMKTLVSDLRSRWMPSAEEAGVSASGTGGETLIRLTLAPDGHVVAMKLEGSTKDASLDRAAWNAAKSTTYLPLPARMQETALTLRVHFPAK